MRIHADTRSSKGWEKLVGAILANLSLPNFLMIITVTSSRLELVDHLPKKYLTFSFVAILQSESNRESIAQTD